MFNRIALKNYIDIKGLKQKVIAEKANMTESQLSLILKGKRNCEINEYTRICKAIGVPITKFIIKNQDSA